MAYCRLYDYHNEDVLSIDYGNLPHNVHGFCTGASIIWCRNYFRSTRRRDTGQPGFQEINILDTEPSYTEARNATVATGAQYARGLQNTRDLYEPALQN
jgi:hypothetical protein